MKRGAPARMQKPALPAPVSSPLLKSPPALPRSLSPEPSPPSPPPPSAEHSLAAEYLSDLLATFQEEPVSLEHVQAVLSEAEAAGLQPTSLYLSALKLHPADLPLPPDPRLVFAPPSPAEPPVAAVV